LAVFRDLAKRSAKFRPLYLIAVQIRWSKTIIGAKLVRWAD